MAICLAMLSVGSCLDEETEQSREDLLDFLSKRHGTDERKATVDGIIFLKKLKT
jgi:hypothetical protein